MNDFVNEPVDLDAIPRLGGEAFVSVHRNYLRGALIAYGIVAAIVLVGGVVLAFSVPRGAWLPLVGAGLILVLLGIGAWAKVLEVRHIGYQVRDHDLSYRHGILIKTESTVPFARVQHARIRQGPVQRALGIATVDVNSAGPDLHIAGLGADQAERLKNLVLERAGDLVEE